MLDDYSCALTDELDKHLLYSHLPYMVNSYIMEYESPKLWSIRFPGATRGHVIVNKNMIIKSIVLYEDTCFGNGIGCYKESVKIITDKFIGTKLELKLIDFDTYLLERTEK